MITKAEVKLIHSLSQKKYRDEEKLFIVEGEKMAEELQESRLSIQKLYSTVPIQPRFAFPSEQISEEEMKKISGLKTPSPVLAVVHQPTKTLSTAIPLNDLVLAIDEVQDPGNLGTIIRLADWFGIRHIVCSPHTADCFNPKVVQATMGAIFRVNITYGNLPDFLLYAAKTVPVYGAFLNGENLYGTPLKQPSVLVMGNEGNGISKDAERHITSRLFIPPFPANQQGSESLNVATSTAIICAEFRRCTAIQSGMLA